MPWRCLAAALFLVAGCSAQKEFSRLDPALTGADLRQGKVAVLGVVKIQEPDQIRPPLIAMLERTLREERPDLPLVGSDSVLQMLGTERDRNLLLQYEYQGKLDEDALAEIATSLRGRARYLLVARVEKDQQENSTRGISPSDTTTAAHVLYTIGVTARRSRVEVHLYDLSRRVLMVDAAIKGSAENEHPMLAPRSGGIMGVRNIPPEEKGYPPVPDLARALEQPFRDFARMLPR